MTVKRTSPSDFPRKNHIYDDVHNDIEWWTTQNASKCLRSAILCPRIRAKSLEFSRTCRCRNKVRNLRQQAKGEMKLHRAENERIIPHHERRSCIPMFSLHWKPGQLKCKRGKVTVHFKGDSSTLEVLMKTVLAVNQRTTHHTVWIWYNRLQKMHHGELDFDFNFCR